ncbi:MAG: hypothetical protein Q8S00_12375 [Deltaproteobacteria bacterium]|nr:hypothetical protein [Deltaproteobacteria bacterium]MDZ4347521.1 hypothetical protein [Candidatus Binatia bacterium]
MKADKRFQEVLDAFTGQVQLVYHRFADKKPVIELELPAQRIAAYAHSEYLKTLSPRSRAMLKRDYAQAKAKCQIVLFVRDNDARTLRSCRIPIESIDYAEVW